MKKVLVLAAVLSLFSVASYGATLKVWITTPGYDENYPAANAIFDIQVWAEIIGDNAGMYDMAITVKTPGTLFKAEPLAAIGATREVRTTWGSLAVWGKKINAARSDGDADGDLDANQMAVGGFELADSGITSLLIGTMKYKWLGTALTNVPTDFVVTVAPTSRYIVDDGEYTTALYDSIEAVGTRIGPIPEPATLALLGLGSLALLRRKKA